jgi:hypothetical protein
VHDWFCESCVYSDNTTIDALCAFALLLVYRDCDAHNGIGAAGVEGLHAVNKYRCLSVESTDPLRVSTRLVRACFL